MAGCRAPVAAVSVPGSPFQLRKPRTAKATASLAWAGMPRSSVVRTAVPGTASRSQRNVVWFALPPPDSTSSVRPNSPAAAASKSTSSRVTVAQTSGPDGSGCTPKVSARR